MRVRGVARGMTLAAAAAGLSYAAYVATAYLRYGRAARQPAGAGHDTPIDRFLPHPEVAERHEVRVAAPAAETFAAARELDLRRSPLVRAVFAARELVFREREERAERPAGFVDETLALGWGMLADEPGRRIVVGAVTRPWEGHVEFRALPPDDFAAFDEPGYAKIVWTLEAHPRGADASLFRTETRVATTDPESRERFRRYWATFSPGILLIRIETLRLVRAEAERRASGAPVSRGS